MSKVDGIRNLLCRWLAKETRGLIGGVVGGLMGGLAAVAAINYCTRVAALGNADPVSIANTYIVYTTFVIAAVAVFLTIAGLIFTQHFAMEKQTHVAHAFEALVNDLCSANGKAVELIKEVMKHPEVVQHMDDSVKGKLAEVVASNIAQAGQRAFQAKTEQEQLQALSADLEHAQNGGTKA